jgi:hypothetical protein
VCAWSLLARSRYFLAFVGAEGVGYWLAHNARPTELAALPQQWTVSNALANAGGRHNEGGAAQSSSKSSRRSKADGGSSKMSSLGSSDTDRVRTSRRQPLFDLPLLCRFVSDDKGGSCRGLLAQPWCASNRAYAPSCLGAHTRSQPCSVHSNLTALCTLVNRGLATISGWAARCRRRRCGLTESRCDSLKRCIDTARHVTSRRITTQYSASFLLKTHPDLPLAPSIVCPFVFFDSTASWHHGGKGEIRPAHICRGLAVEVVPMCPK